jgi:phosphoheptose isomerase
MFRDSVWNIERVRDHLTMSARVKESLAAEASSAIVAGARLMEETFIRKGKVLICGNGGSAADSQHMAAELVTRLNATFERPPLPAIALTTDTSLLTAYANDHDFGGIFQRQVLALGNPGDLLVAISTSGTSENVVRAADAARQRQMKILTLTGESGMLRTLADVAITVPSKSTQHIQEAHLAIEHILCDLVEQQLFGFDERDTPEEDIQA